MRYVLFAVLMTGIMLGVVTWASKPEVLEAQYDRVAKPIEDHFAEQRAMAWQAAKDQAWQQWLTRAHLPGDCQHPTSSLRALECKNQLELQAHAFESDWANKVAGGWQPQGIN